MLQKIQNMLTGFFQRFIAPVASTLSLNLDQNFLEELISGWLSENPVVAKMLGIEPAQQAKASVDPTDADNTQEIPETDQSATGPESGQKPDSALANKFQQHAHGALRMVYDSLGATANDTALKKQIDQLAGSLGKLGLTESFNTEVNDRLADIKLANLEPATIREAVTGIFNTHSDDQKAQTAALVALGETIHAKQNPEPASTPDTKLASATP